ncbi:hypothetical protein LUZ60_010581 [Juncus effusus]|nr:hypothetical protein LUZ60_010581 [Juncus effusus]
MKPKLFLSVFCVAMVFIFYRMQNFQHEETMLDERVHPFDSTMESNEDDSKIGDLPRGIMQSQTDLEMRPLWFTKTLDKHENNKEHKYLLAIPVGIKQKQSVDFLIKKFLSENFTAILFHYDGNVDGWNDLDWSKNVIHISAFNQTKWWFAKRFLHPDIVSNYDYIFLWDEDLGVDNFNPSRYVKIIESEGLEISQPALDPSLSEVHHRITIRRKNRLVHRRVYDKQGSDNCSSSSEGPPCTGWVEGMAPVFSRSAWQCAWHLIQNDLIHGWGLDMKFGYCAQGNRKKKVGVVDSEFIVHKGVQTLGGSSETKNQSSKGKRDNTSRKSKQVPHRLAVPGRGRIKSDARVEVRRRAKFEQQRFKERWDQAAREDKVWVDPFKSRRKEHLD